MRCHNSVNYVFEQQKGLLESRPRSHMKLGFSSLILGNLGDCTHRALLEAFAATDASIFVHDFGDTAGNFQNFLRASVDANATTDALVSINQGTCHSELLFQSKLGTPKNLSLRKIPLLAAFASTVFLFSSFIF